MRVRREEDNVELARLTKGSERCKTVHTGHLHVQNHQIRRGRAQDAQRLFTRTGFLDFADFGIAIEKTPHLAPRRRLVVHNENPNHVWYGTATVTASPPSAQFSNSSACPSP